MRAVGAPLGRRRSQRRRATALDRALDTALAGTEPRSQDAPAEIAAARALSLSAPAEPPPDEALVVLRAALAAGASGPAPRPRQNVWRPAVAVSMLAASLVALVAIRPGHLQHPDQAYLARNLARAGQQINVIESRAAVGDIAYADSNAEQLRAALFRTEQAAAQLDPRDPAQQKLLVTLESEIARLNDLLSRLHLKVSPLPIAPGYPPAPSPRASGAPARPAPTTTTTTNSPAPEGGTAIATQPPAPTGPLPVVPNSTLAFPDAQHGWLVVPGRPSGSPTTWSASVLLATADGGHTWSQQLNETSAPLVGVDFVDATHGWAVAGAAGPMGTQGGAVYGAALLRTTDGGITWHEAGEPPSPLGRVYFVDAQRGWGVTADNRVVRTSDGGDTWVPAGADSATTPPVSSLCIAGDGAVAWAATPGQPLGSGTPEVLRSYDGGADWAVSFTGGSDWGAQQADVGCDTRSAWALYDLSPAAGQDLAVVERTGDGGAHWSAVLLPEGHAAGPRPVSSLTDAGPFSVVDARTARFSEACPQCSLPEGAVVTTDDGGLSSTTAALPGSGGPPVGMAFSDADHGFAATVSPPGARDRAGGFQVFATADGARTWRLLFTG